MKLEHITSVPKLPDRPADAHKGIVGRILVVAGSLGDEGMVGAPSLTANAALRSGAGLVQIATQRTVMPHLAALVPCATTRTLEGRADDLTAVAVTFGADVVAIGPGLRDTVTGEQIVNLLGSFSGGLVIDADAINALATVGKWSAKWPHNVVLTPHPGEMKRLLDGWGLNLDVKQREDCAARYAQQTGVNVVLKGAGTVVTDGRRLYVNQTGNAGMATGGTGDILTGVIAALIGQKMEAFDAAVLGVHVHGLAGDTAAEELGRISLIATDLLRFLPEAFSDLRFEG